MRVLLLIIALSFIQCGSPPNNSNKASFIGHKTIDNQSIINSNSNVLEDRIACPKDYYRTKNVDAFAKFLRLSPLKKHGSSVRFFDGTEKDNKVHVAVLDYDVGHRDLQQCADAVMRLRAEYLYAESRFDEIHFNFTNGDRIDYSKWRDGGRIKVSGNKVSWYQGAKENRDYPTFRKYLDIIYTYAGTLSLEKELKPVSIDKMRIGDVFIQGGSPGHAVIVMDMCENDESEKLFMLAQSYMPAQDIHILKNLKNQSISPWYKLDESSEISTPEWLFYSSDLKRFE